MTRAAEVPTPVGAAWTVTEGPAGGVAVVLGHGAGGGIDAPDLLAARDAGLAAGLRVVRVEQPWRVRGRRVAEAPARLDLAWTAVLAQVDGPVVVGGRSAGARVACRTAAEVGAVAVLALAFPLHPPGRPGRSRGDELQAPTVPRLVVQGDRDAFGVPEPEPGVQVHVVPGADHAFAVRRRDGCTADEVLGEVREVVTHWLAQLAQTLT
jgi:predicted alpha/beta-hydrolase family hydrolase